MTIDPARILDGLKPSGFEKVSFNDESRDYGYVRASEIPGLFEQVRVKCGGKNGEVAWANVGISCVRACPTKGLIELRLLTEIATDVERGWADVAKTERARGWEAKLIATAPVQASLLARQHGPSLLARTEVSRAAVEQYLRLASEDRQAVVAIQDDPEKQRLVARLAEGPGIVQCHAMIPAYRDAAVLVVAFASRVRGGGPITLQTEPLRDPDLMMRIQLLADAIHGRWRSGSGQA